MQHVSRWWHWLHPQQQPVSAASHKSPVSHCQLVLFHWYMNEAIVGAAVVSTWGMPVLKTWVDSCIDYRHNSAGSNSPGQCICCPFHTTTYVALLRVPSYCCLYSIRGSAMNKLQFAFSWSLLLLVSPSCTHHLSNLLALCLPGRHHCCLRTREMDMNDYDFHLCPLVGWQANLNINYNTLKPITDFIISHLVIESQPQYLQARHPSYQPVISAKLLKGFESHMYVNKTNSPQITTATIL